MGWTRFLRRSRWDAERARELEAHLEIETDELIARGVAPDEARWAAQRRLGNPLRIREEIYEMNTLAFVETIWQDLRYAARRLRHDRAFTAVALLSLMLGIGANTAIFQLLDVVRLRSLPVRDPSQLVEVRPAGTQPRPGNVITRYAQLTNPQWERLRAGQQAFSSMLAWAPMRLNLASGGEVRYAQAIFVSGDFFEMLGVSASRGRLLDAADDQRGCGSRAAVISDAFWRREYGGAPDIVGRPVRLEHQAFDIVGVTPAGFYGVEVGRQFDVAVPICAAAVLGGDAGLLDDGFTWWLSTLGRLRPGWSVEQATAQLQAISPALFRETASERLDPEQVEAYRKYRLEAVPRGGGFSSLRTRYEAPLWLLLGLSALVLLVACANLANLLLARAGARTREMAVRLAIGASRGRVVRQLLSESLLLAAIGTLLGAILAREISALLVRFLSTGRDPLSVPIALDWRVLAFTAATALATTMLFGLAPALRATSAPLESVMRMSSRGLTAGRGRSGWQRALVVAQVALSLVMVLVALLFTLSLRNLTGVNTGFSADDLAVADIDFGGVAIPAERRLPLQRELVDGVRSIPGVTSAAQVSIVPLGGWSWRDEVRLEERPQTPLPASFNSVSARYFETMRIPLAAGRDFDDRDTSGSPAVAIVNQTFARRYLKGLPVIGQRIQTRTGPQQWSTMEIVGLVNDTTYADLREPFPPIVYRAAAQERDAGTDLRVVLRSGLSLAGVRSAVAKMAASHDPRITLSFRAFPTMVRETLLRDWLMATLSGFFGVLAIVLASIGLYGVMAYMVARRRSEIGIRLALGASRRSIIRMVMREAILLVGVGLALGALLATAASRAATAMLFGVRPTDLIAITAAVGLLATVGFIASYLPARRAARLQPTHVLPED